MKKKGFNQLYIFVWTFNKFLYKNKAIKDFVIENSNKISSIKTFKYLIKLDFRVNKEINTFFSLTQALLGITSNLANAYI